VPRVLFPRNSAHKAKHHWQFGTLWHDPTRSQPCRCADKGDVGYPRSAVCTVVEHGHSFALHDRINWQIDGLKSVEENQGKLLVAESVTKMASASHS
jgi:hypothetical protein